MLGGRCHGRRRWAGASSSCPAPARDGRQLLYLLHKDKQRPGALRGRMLPRSCRKGLLFLQSHSTVLREPRGCKEPGGHPKRRLFPAKGSSEGAAKRLGPACGAQEQNVAASGVACVVGRLLAGRWLRRGQSSCHPVLPTPSSVASFPWLRGDKGLCPLCPGVGCRCWCSSPRGAGDLCKPCSCSRRKSPRKSRQLLCLLPKLPPERSWAGKTWQAGSQKGSVGMPPAGPSPVLCHGPGPPRTSRCCGDLLDATPPCLSLPSCTWWYRARQHHRHKGLMTRISPRLDAAYTGAHARVCVRGGQVCAKNTCSCRAGGCTQPPSLGPPGDPGPSPHAGLAQRPGLGACCLLHPPL